MGQVVPVPEGKPICGLNAQHALYSSLRQIGAIERKNQIQIGSALDDVSDAAKNAIYFSKGPKSIAVDSLQGQRLFDQFLVVVHDSSPRPTPNHSTIGSKNRTLKFPAPGGIQLCAALRDSLSNTVRANKLTIKQGQLSQPERVA